MIAELHEAILKACVGHAGMLVGVASASGASSLTSEVEKLATIVNLAWLLMLNVYIMVVQLFYSGTKVNQSTQKNSSSW